MSSSYLHEAPIEGEAIAGYGEESGDDRGFEERTGELPVESRDILPGLLKNLKVVNLAEDLDEGLLDEIGQRVKTEYEIDVTSRSDWKEKADKARKLALQEAEEKTYPWPKASNIIYPLITTACLQFAARAYPAIIQSRNVVKGVVVGQDKGTPVIGPGGQIAMDPNTGQPQWKLAPGQKRVRADKIAEHMSFQLLDEQEEWEPETDLLLHVLPIDGCCARKSFYDPAVSHNRSLYVSMLKLVVNYHAKSLETAPRITEEFELYPIEIEDKIRAGVFLDIDYMDSPKTGYEGDVDAPQDFLEQHRWWDLDDDGYPEPYIVTIHKESSKVARIVARYDTDGIKVKEDGSVKSITPVHYYTLYQFLPNPDSNIYGMGFGYLLRSINESINTTLNQMFDAGHLQNTGGGFISAGLSMHTGSVKFQPGQFNPVNAAGTPVRDSVYVIPFPGPSPVLFQLLGFLVQGGKEIAGIKDILMGDQGGGQNMPATTTLALIEQGLKAFSAIYKRVHRSLKTELNKLYRLNRIYLTEEASYRIGDDWKSVTKADYAEGSGVEPYSDPNAVTDMQRLGRAQFLLGFKDDPRVNGVEILRRAMDAAQIEKVEDIVIAQPPPDPGAALDMALKQAEVGRIRAAESKDWAQGILNLATAKKTASESDIAWLDSSLSHMRLHLEAVNTAIKAAELHGKAAKELHERATADISSTGGEGDHGGGLHKLAPPSGDEMVPGLPRGLPGGVNQGTPAALGGGQLA